MDRDSNTEDFHLKNGRKRKSNVELNKPKKKKRRFQKNPSESASSSEGLFDPGISFSSMKQPPLIKQLKGILSEYPDGGQILKELIQNAEDAEATEVRILYDGRNVNEDVSEETFNKFFKGPALCVFNDAIFTEDDWDGIRMIYSSVKEENPLKVGRFGLGFKSVFHITDYPCVISGNKLLMIDPQQPSDRVNAMVNLSSLGTLENHGLAADAFWAALDRTFGMNRESAKNGFFRGSIFWFPLRQKASQLSETLYDELKVMNLLDSFQSEASCILLFLKNLARITVLTREQSLKISEYIRVEIEDDNGNISQKRRHFKERIKEMDPNYEGEDIKSEILLSVSTTIKGQRQMHKWMVVNYFVGNTSTTDFRQLITDTSFGYSPYVGVAAPVLNYKDDFEGHVYCFLPLPREGSRLTGLPLHVNGSFALSQNRHHLKWETDEQKGRKIDDKAILWNKCLIEEALPRAYDTLIQALISMAVSKGNTSEMVELVYGCLPTSSNVQSRWTLLANKLYARLFTSAIFYNAYNNKWVSLSDSTFATFDSLLCDCSRVQSAVKSCLNEIGKYYVDISPALFETLKRHHHEIQDLTPQILSQYLLQSSSYRNMSPSCKLDILTYILSDNVYEKLDGLELLPLQSGEWKSFNRSGEVVFCCNNDVSKILPGQEQKLVLNTSSLGKHFKQLCSNGLFQVRSMTSTDLVSLLEKTIACKLGMSAKLQLNSSTFLSVEWLKHVWKYISKTRSISNYTTLRIVPVLKSGTWEKPKQIDLVSLSELLLVRQKDGDRLSNGVCRCFEVMGVSILESLPEWIPENLISQFCFWPLSRSIITLISRISSVVEIKDITAKFNQTCSSVDRKELRRLLVKSQFEMKEQASPLIRDLQLFQAVHFINESGFETSVSQCPQLITGREKFPASVKLPFACIKMKKTSVKDFIMRLGAREVSVDDLVTETLKRFLSERVHTKDEKKIFMDYFISNFHLFKDNKSTLQLARKLCFLRTDQNSREYKTEELFDPSNDLINDLLYGEALVPVSNSWTKGDNIMVLRCLGLKEIKHLDATIVLRVANTIDQWCREGKSVDRNRRKAEALMKVLCNRPTFLNDICTNGVKLGECIKSLACIPVQDKLASYPKCLKWYKQNSVVCRPSNAKEVSLNFIIGGVVPTVVCQSEQVINFFQWREPPALCHVFEQLKMIRTCYSVDKKSELMSIIKALYEHLSEREDEILEQRSMLPPDQAIWTGQEFVDTSKVTVYNEVDNLDLCPYFFSLSEEYSHIYSMFVALGCYRHQDSLILQKALYAIRDAHVNSQHDLIVRRDRRIVCEILERISKMILENGLPLSDLELLIMVQDTDPNKLTLRPVSECSYDDDPSCFYEDDGIYLVHEMIAVEIAESLGVKSITRRAALEAEEIGVEEWGQKERLTTRIHALLRDGYTDGLSIPKELIQNADDAGASSVKFLYDERLNLQIRERLLSKGMKTFQGPALWVFNNAKFSDDDLRNITKLNEGTKQKDVKKIGKFGLGFCSVYNLTDLPSFITGSSIIFFDPHEKYLGSFIRRKGTGLRYRLPNRNLVSRHIDQFKPYDGIFECNIIQDTFSEYNGTLFRLPLRTEQQAKDSQINSVSYTHDEMIELLHKFIKAAGNMLIFSQNVRCIEIYHLAEEATQASEARLIFQMHKDSLRMNNKRFRPVSESVLNRLPGYLRQKKSFIEIQKINVKQIVKSSCKQLIKFLDDVSNTSETAWLVSWANGNGKSLDMSKSMLHEGAVPLSATAIPVENFTTCSPVPLEKVCPGFYKDGHLFCFLPLPLRTDLHIHINGCFAVTSDRRRLVCTTEDEKSNKKADWNTVLLEDASVVSFVSLLEALTNNALKVRSSYKYYDIWPICSSKDVLPFKMAFYRHILDSPVKVFYGNQTWAAFNDVTFLDPDIQKQTYGDLAFEVMSHFAGSRGKTFIEMPSCIFENILKYNPNKMEEVHRAVIREKDVFLTILKNINGCFWTGRLAERNLLIAAAINSCDSDVEKIIRSMKCIPTNPFQNLKKPEELIHPNSFVSGLFSLEDERFPIDTQEFRRDTILKKLVQLGMIDYLLPQSLLIDRCKSISSIAETCATCSRRQIVYLIEYICKDDVLTQIEANQEISTILKDLFIFPVLTKPRTWKFPWFANVTEISLRSFGPKKHCQNHSSSRNFLLLGQSKNLHREMLCDYIGSIACMIDENVFKSGNIGWNDFQRMLEIFGVKGLSDLPVQMLVEQICILSREYQNTKSQYTELNRLHNKMFKKLEQIVVHGPESSLTRLGVLRDIPVVLIGCDLVRTDQVALNVKEEYKPMLCKLPKADILQFKTIYNYLGVNKHFDTTYILKLMANLKSEWKSKDKINVKHITALLVNLKDCMDRTKKTYEALHEFHDLICAPDTNFQLYPTYELATEYVDFETNVVIKTLHRDIPPSLGEALGVKAKEWKCFENISIGVSFGQREKLVTRIKGLLKAYPCDASLMKELLQNADDAGASEIYFIKDYRNHSTDRLFSKSCEPLQGPSLCVYNNSYFTKCDLEGIHNLGQGSKTDDPNKTGQYGVGFNAVYHLTDTPAFISKGPAESDNFLLILDPLCKHVPKATHEEPGQLCRLSDVQNNFPDHLLGFSKEKLISEDVGTVFRFPLRRKPSQIGQGVISPKQLDILLDSFKKEMHEAVLFLKNIQCIKVLNVTTSELKEEYSVTTQLSDSADTSRKQFYDTVRSFTNQEKCEKENYLDINSFEVSYPLKVIDCDGLSMDWLIVQRFGPKYITEKTNELKNRIRDRDLGLLPIGGVAIPLDNKKKKSCLSTKQDHARQQTSNKNSQSYGKAFCFLPLPILTGLPVHINGHFALDHEARRELWKDGYRMDWNNFILETIVVPAWISGLVFTQQNIHVNVKTATKWHDVNHLMDNYHKLFPLHGSAQSKVWRDVVSLFYSKTMLEKAALFPYVRDRKSDNVLQAEFGDTGELRFLLNWTHLTCTVASEIAGVFACVTGFLDSLDLCIKRSRSVESLLKSFGMKLIETPRTIHKAIQEAGIQDVPFLSPALVLKFLKGPTCDIGPVNIDITSSKFISVENLYDFVFFISKDKHFADQIENLPVLLTEDNTLRVFSKENAVFVSKFSNLLPKSSCLFVKSMFIPFMLDEKLFKTRICKQFCFRDLVTLLPHSLKTSVFAVGADIPFGPKRRKSQDTLSREWLSLFYDFLSEESQTEGETISPFCGHRDMFNRRDKAVQKFRTNIDLLKDWSFLPCIKGEKVRPCLVPIRDAPHMLFLSNTDKSDKLGIAVNKLSLPTIDTSSFSECENKDLIIMLVTRYIASLQEPSSVLKCLAYHIDKIRKFSKVDDATEIMAYLNRNFSVLERDMEKHVVAQKLRTLPLFITLQGTLTSINDNNYDVLVIPRDIPNNGIQEWANMCRVILLKENYSFNTLFGRLGLQKASIEFVYGEKILPEINKMPVKYWMDHIIFLRDRFRPHITNSPGQEKIKQGLKEIAFVEVNGVTKKVNDLFDPENEIFKCMKDKSDFPPERFHSFEWQYFLRELGLICDVNDEMILAFAREIEQENRNKLQLPDTLGVKSERILRRFLKNNGKEWQPSTLESIRTVRFIKPCEISQERLQIWPQFDNDRLFICFQDSVPCSYKSLCWTSMSLLPPVAYTQPYINVRRMLGIYEEPPVDKVIMHFQNICDVLKHRLKTSDINSKFVEDHVTCMYEYFSNHMEAHKNMRSRLQCTPFVHLPDDNDLVLADEVIIDLPTDCQIKPYLYQAPKFYGKFHKLFESLGSKNIVLFSHYASILNKIKEKCQDSVMTPPERRILQKTVDGLLRVNLASDKSAKEVQYIYLPNQNLILMKSTDVIVINRCGFEERLCNENINFFAGLSFLEVSEHDYSLCSIFSKWPAHLKPSLLSEVVKETVCLDSDDRILQSTKAVMIENFLHSGEFFAALCGILQGQFGRERKNVDETFVLNVVSDLNEIRVFELPFIRTVLKYNGQYVCGSETSIPCHIETEERGESKRLIFYFTDTSENNCVDIGPILPSLSHLLRTCVPVIDTESFEQVIAILQCVYDPLKLPEILMRFQIKPFVTCQTMSNEYFPKPGTYVEQRFIPYLEQGIEPFKEDEYRCVAMELEDNNDGANDEENGIYVYVEILRECQHPTISGDLGRMYIVVTGNPDVDSEQVPIYRLFRFVRRETDPGTDLQFYDSEPISSKPFDDQCTRIRKDLKEVWKLSVADRKCVIRRLLLKWHPDKNRGNEDYCTKVFQYIKIVISRLENSEIIHENVAEEMSRGPSHFSQSSSTYYNNINRRAKSYAQAYYDNLDQYRSQGRTGVYNHRSAVRNKISDADEAKRWMRQAKGDLKAAFTFSPIANDVSGYNWICYLCHQACEKALKAAKYLENANDVPNGSRSHRLSSLTSDEAILQQIRKLESRFPDHARLRYPDAVSRPMIPSDIFTEDDAKFAFETAQKLVSLVDDDIS